MHKAAILKLSIHSVCSCHNTLTPSQGQKPNCSLHVPSVLLLNSALRVPPVKIQNPFELSNQGCIQFEPFVLRNDCLLSCHHALSLGVPCSQRCSYRVSLPCLWPRSGGRARSPLEGMLRMRRMMMGGVIRCRLLLCYFSYLVVMMLLFSGWPLRWWGVADGGIKK